MAVEKDVLSPVTKMAFRPQVLEPEPVLLRLGDLRYATFIFGLRSDGVHITKLDGKHEPWGFLVLFVSMESIDSTAGRLRLYMVYLTALLVLVAMLFILAVSRRLVRPLDPPTRLTISFAPSTTWLETFSAPSARSRRKFKSFTTPTKRFETLREASSKPRRWCPWGKSWRVWRTSSIIPSLSSTAT
jgi:hypothetical protein